MTLGILKRCHQQKTHLRIYLERQSPLSLANMAMLILQHFRMATTQGPALTPSPTPTANPTGILSQKVLITKDTAISKKSTVDIRKINTSFQNFIFLSRANIAEQASTHMDVSIVPDKVRKLSPKTLLRKQNPNMRKFLTRVMRHEGKIHRWEASFLALVRRPSKARLKANKWALIKARKADRQHMAVDKRILLNNSSTKNKMSITAPLALGVDLKTPKRCLVARPPSDILQRQNLCKIQGGSTKLNMVWAITSVETR